MHIGFDFPSTTCIDELLGRLCDYRVSVVVQPIDQRSNRRIFLILDDGRVVEEACRGSRIR
jgi:hypothetical protein